jgi:hypothetical protein
MPPIKLRRPSRAMLAAAGARLGGRIFGGRGSGVQAARARQEGESAKTTAIIGAKDAAAQQKAYHSLLHEHKNRDAHREFVREFNNNLSRMPKGFRNSLDEATRRHVKFTLLQLGYTKKEVKTLFDGMQQIMKDHGIPPNPRQFLLEHVNTIKQNIEQQN